MAGKSSPLIKFAIVAAAMCTALALLAQEGVTKRVHFARGQSSVVLKNAVVRGTRDKYLLGAKAGQTMTVRITSVEHNAVFSIAKPDGGFLSGATDESDAMKWAGKLPASGEYVIEVGGTRGNADYSLKIAIN